MLVAQLNDQEQFASIKSFFESENPDLRLTLAAVSGRTRLRSEHGGMRVFWLYRGEGEVFLPRGYRTREGDGRPLPDSYTPDGIDRTFAGTLRILKNGLPSLAPAACAAVRRILGRWKDGAFVGDFAGELWQLEQSPRPWSANEEVERAIASLSGMYRGQGFSTKQSDSWEALVSGDQLIACGEEELEVRGEFVCLAMENVERRQSHISSARRLDYLLDNPGGCNPDFDPFRRLPLTWYMNYPGETGDGLNWVNSHIVNIPKEASPTHFHPPRSIGGPGLPQREMYLVLDPRVWRLNTWGRSASLIVYPDLRDLCRYEQHPLEPGMFVYIPPGTGHRGIDVFVNVLTVPGFKPHNEYYIDRDIRDVSVGKSPFNENALDAKNYGRIEDLL
ncbi:MAG: hypothetical protein ACE15B_04935 [Bryobacteraceae bacterium]